MSTIDNIIKVLGYDHSEFLFYRNDFLSKRKKNSLSLHMRKVIQELNPYAVYCVENNPFVLFFEYDNKEHLKSLFRKLWNAQFPIVIISFEDHIEIYNGCSLNTKNNELVYVESVRNEFLSYTSKFSYWNISSSRFWHNYAEKFSTPTLDTVMLNNIKYITDVLKRSPCALFAVQIILRLIFIRFLIDRGVDLNYKKFDSDIAESQNYLLEVMESKDELYSLFLHLKRKFNGNLFELYKDINSGKSEQDILDSSSLAALRGFVSGKLELDPGQYSLFPLYDFNIIPIELISNIYERFLGEEKQKEDKAFYTPPYLVDYVLDQTIKPYLKNNSTCTVLDPACGSGIFLVQAARNLIENNLPKEENISNDDLLVNIVTNNIFGIDKNSEAVDVAIFSIYITMLDYKDPKTLKDFKLPILKDKNFFVFDFFSEEVDNLLRDKHFDFILGNPPWGRVDDGLHIEYCKKKNLPFKNNEISISFIIRTIDFSQENTACCLIVTSKLFYNMKSNAAEFRKWLLTKAQIIKYIELAAVRELIFVNSKGPAAIVFYKFNTNNEEENKNNEICHLVLKPNIFFKLFNIIVIEKNDFKYVKQALLLENDWAWKTIVFGTTLDFYTIKSLKSKYPSIIDIINDNKFISRVGIQTTDGNMDAGFLIGKPLIDSKKGISAFKVDTSFCTIFNKRKIHRSRDIRLFKPPYVLIKKGFDTKTYKLRAAYSEEEFIYRDAITGIVGCKEKKEILLSLTGLINSSLYSYFNLMLGASTGIEREQSFPTDIYKFPAIIDSKIANLVEKIQDSLKNSKWFGNQKNDTEKLIQELDEIVLECFNLKNDPFVDYALNIQIPLLVGEESVYKQVDINQLRKYADVFLEYFNNILLNKQYIGVKAYPRILDRFTALEFIFYDQKPEKPFVFVKENKNLELELFSKFMLNKANDMFYQIKDIIDFEEKSFYILKTDEIKNWHPAIAKLDLSDVLDSILSGGG